MRNHSLIRFRSIMKFSKFRNVILNDDNGNENNENGNDEDKKNFTMLRK